MLSPVYRNLDRSLLVGGLRPVELVVASATYLITAEASRFVGLGRQWAIAFTVVSALAVILGRKYLGEGVAARTLRFARLPRHLYPRLRQSEDPRA